MRADHTLVVAVDGGGTRCRIAASDGDRMWMVEAGSANASTDFEEALHEINTGLEGLAEQMGCPVSALHAARAFVGLAGVTGPAIEGRLRSALPFEHMRVSDDREAAVRGVLGTRDGVVGHCGTGSFYARQLGGAVTLAGGWGPVLGDEASAQWAGRYALRLTLETVDGRLRPSPLSARLLDDFEGAAGIVGFAAKARPSDFGELAPLVTEYAARQDAIACQIMQRGADEISRALRHVGWRPGLAVCLTGGIGPHYAPFLARDLRTDLAQAEMEPLDGAIALARDLAQEIANDRN
ncbi:BadF/BadG/BcrA/BcrD ATPase family protein [Aestuariibius sp. 2305UL40-4]|uniref:BadF/BadG/BcrA/BcrD ATPase family protein n=1 Tax=Aestuariibius violaceus TaxID=3234132 RepID=UPI00345EAA2E